MKLKGLGRGLDALLAGNEAQGREQQRSLAVGNLQPGKYQPRTQMDNASLEELAASISMQEQEKKRETLFGTIIGNGGDDDVRNNE